MYQPTDLAKFRLNRRRLLTAFALTGLGGGVGVLAACAPSAAPAAAPTTAAGAPPAAVAKPAATQAAAQAAPTTAPAAAQPAAASGALKTVPRNRTLISSFHANDTQYSEADIWNPYCIGGTHQHGVQMFFEPLAYYSAFADKTTMWLAESFKYSTDFKQLVIKTRSGVNWSDGKPFTAEDVAFTLNSLKELGPKVTRGVEVSTYVNSAKAVDANTVQIDFKVPAPRFFYFMTYKYDIGLYIVPKHVFEGQDWSTFKNLDPSKGWPLTTGPWKVATTSPQQKILDRREGQYWANKAGLTQGPKAERMIFLPSLGETQSAQAAIGNQVDMIFMQVQNIKPVIAQNPKLITHSLRGEPYGYIDWWPLALYVNHTKEPLGDPDVRWAISYFIDRQQIVDVGYGGTGSPSVLPMPAYPALQPFFDEVKDLLGKYPTNLFDPSRGAALLTNKGYKKNSGGMWEDAQGTPLKLEIMGPNFTSSIGPIIGEQLRRQGIDTTFSMPPDASRRFTAGDYVAMISGHGGSVSGDPYFTLRLFQTASQVVPGQAPTSLPRWSNTAYDKVVDDMYLTPTDQAAKLKELFRKAMEIWLPELPDIQLTKFYHNVALNQTYWKGWPTQENPYINGCNWHSTYPLVVNTIDPVE